MIVYTVGYEGLSINDFMSLLAKHRIETVVDIRELPLSRKPGFSKKALATVLDESGLMYIHMRELGCPKPVRTHYRMDGDWKRYKAGFLKHLGAQKDAITELAKVAEASKCALLCFEADYNFCHRSMVAAAVGKRCGADIRHLHAKATKSVSRLPARS